MEWNAPLAKIFPVDRQINLKTRERVWCLARLMLRLPTRAPASRDWNANPSRKGSRLSASASTWYTRVPPPPPPPRYLRTPTLTRSHRTSCLCHQNCWTKRRIKIRRPSHQGKRLFSSRFLRLARVIADSWADFTVSVYRFTMGLWKRLSSFQRREWSCNARNYCTMETAVIWITGVEYCGDIYITENYRNA